MFTQLISTFATGSYAVTTEGAGSYVSGIWVPGAGAVVNVSAYIEPLSGADLQMSFDGYHTSDLRKMFCKDEVAMNAEVTFQGEQWRVVQVNEWQGFGTLQADNYYENIIARQAKP